MARALRTSFHDTAMHTRFGHAPHLLTLAVLLGGTACQRAPAATAGPDGAPAPVAGPGGTATAAESARTPIDVIQGAGWLAGHWRGEGLGGENEVLWSPLEAGGMMGVFRHMKEGRVVFYEFLTLSRREDGVVLAIKHFDPDMTGWEERTRSIEFPLLRAEADVLYFDGMTYRRTAPDEREVTVMLGPDAENLRPERFTYRRVQP